MNDAIVLQTIIFLLTGIAGGVATQFWLTGHIPNMKNIFDIFIPSVFFAGIILFKNGDTFIGKINSVTTSVGSGTICGVLSVFISSVVKALYKKDPIKALGFLMSFTSNKTGEVLDRINALPDKQDDSIEENSNTVTESDTTETK